jgi:hypothetical protein
MIHAIFLALILTISPAQAHTFNCDQVRSYVAQHGKAKALAAAVKHGATWREIVAARKCLKKETR